MALIGINQLYATYTGGSACNACTYKQSGELVFTWQNNRNNSGNGP